MDRLAEWVRRNPRASFLDPEQLSVENDDLQVGDLAAVLKSLVAIHQLEIRFKVKSPYDNAFADAVFDKPFVEKEIYDQSERLFNTLDGEFVPVLMEPRGEVHE